MVAWAMDFGSATEEDAEWGRGVSRKDGDKGEQGEKAAHGGRLSAKVQKCKGAKLGKGVGAGAGVGMGVLIDDRGQMAEA